MIINANSVKVVVNPANLPAWEKLSQSRAAQALYFVNYAKPFLQLSSISNFHFLKMFCLIMSELEYSMKNAPIINHHNLNTRKLLV